MAGSIGNMAAVYKKKNFTYVPPTPPAELIETTCFTLDFANRKFVHIGIEPTEKYQVVDPSEKYEVVVNILTSSRHVKILPDFLRRIFSMMGQILSYILDVPQKYKCTIFLETDTYLREKCDLLKSPPKNLEDMIIYVKNAQDERMVKSFPNLTGQIQMFAAKQLAASLLNKATHESHSGAIDLPVSPSFSLISSMDSSEDPESKSLIPDGADVNDGPDYFNQFRESSLFITPPPPSQLPFAEHPAPVRNVKRRLF